MLLQVQSDTTVKMHQVTTDTAVTCTTDTIVTSTDTTVTCTHTTVTFYWHCCYIFTDTTVTCTDTAATFYWHCCDLYWYCCYMCWHHCYMYWHCCYMYRHCCYVLLTLLLQILTLLLHVWTLLLHVLTLLLHVLTLLLHVPSPAGHHTEKGRSYVWSVSLKPELNFKANKNVTSLRLMKIMHRSAMLWMVSRHKQHASNPQHELFYKRRHALHSNMLYGTYQHMKHFSRQGVETYTYLQTTPFPCIFIWFSMTRSIPKRQAFFIYLVVSDQFLCTNVHNYKNCTLSSCLWLF